MFLLRIDLRGVADDPSDRIRSTDSPRDKGVLRDPETSDRETEDCLMLCVGVVLADLNRPLNWLDVLAALYTGGALYGPAVGLGLAWPGWRFGGPPLPDGCELRLPGVLILTRR